MLAAALALVAVMAAVAFSTPGAAGDTYRPGAVGYDVSYPQCSVGPPGGGFAVLGINHGRPFRYNPCLGAQYRAAPKEALPSVYLNTGYDRYYDRWLTADCKARARQQAGTTDQRHAWAIGCSEASTAASYAARQGLATPSMWWLDVEKDNSWSETSPQLNRSTIQGAVDFLRSDGRIVGIYSNSRWWAAITGGGWSPQGVTADWVGTVRKASTGANCGTGFSGHPVWLVQYIEDYFDRDYACR